MVCWDGLPTINPKLSLGAVMRVPGPASMRTLTVAVTVVVPEAVVVLEIGTMMLKEIDMGCETLTYKSPDELKVTPGVSVVMGTEGEGAETLSSKGVKVGLNVMPDLYTVVPLEPVPLEAVSGDASSY